MDANAMRIAHLLSFTLDATNKERRADAEAQLKGGEKIIGFAPALLQIAMVDGGPDKWLEVAPCPWIAVRQAAVVMLKNFVSNNWTEPDENADFRAGNVVSPTTAKVFSVHEQDKAFIRQHLLAGIIELCRWPDLDATVVASPAASPTETRVSSDGAAPVAHLDRLVVQLAFIFKIIAREDFPHRWPDLADSIAARLQSPNGPPGTAADPSCWPGCMTAIAMMIKNYEYRKREARAPLYTALLTLWPLTHDVAVQCTRQIVTATAGDTSGPVTPHTSIAVTVRKIVMKTLRVLSQYTLPLDIMPEVEFTKWMEVVNSVILQRVPSFYDSLDDDEKAELSWWKEKKWALAVVARIIDRYAAPAGVAAEYREFGPWFVKTFAAGLTKSMLQLLDLYRSNVFVSSRVLQHIMSFLDSGVAHVAVWSLIRPHLVEIVEQILLPLLSFSESDAELWDSDPHEYVRVKFDILEDMVSPVSAAQTLLLTVCRRRRGTLDQVMDVVMAHLQTPGALTAERRDGALQIIGSLSTLLLSRKRYKSKLQDFIVHVVFPDFEAPVGHLRARACWLIRYLAEVKFSDEMLRLTTDRVVDRLMNDGDVPVRVEAAIALHMLLTAHGTGSRRQKAASTAAAVAVATGGDAAPDSSLEAHLRPHITAITMQLLSLVSATSSDDLTSVVQKVVCHFRPELAPMAGHIGAKLCDNFVQIAGDDDTDMSLVLMGILSTLETLLAVMDTRSGTIRRLLYPPYISLGMFHFRRSLDNLFKSCFMTVHKIIVDDHLESYYEEALCLASDLAEYEIRPELWQLLPAIIQHVFGRPEDGLDYFVDCMPLLHRYVTVGHVELVTTQNQTYLNLIVELTRRILIDGLSGPSTRNANNRHVDDDDDADHVGDDAQVHAAKLLETLVLESVSRRSLDNAQIQAILTMAVRRLFPTTAGGLPKPAPTDKAAHARLARSEELTSMLLQLCLACLYYDRRAFFDVLDCDPSRGTITLAPLLNLLMAYINGGNPAASGTGSRLKAALKQLQLATAVGEADVGGSADSAASSPSATGFTGVHARKMAILGLCLLTEEMRQPVGSNAMATGQVAPCLKSPAFVRCLVPSIVYLFDGIAKAYEARDAAEDSDSDDDSDESDDDDEDAETVDDAQDVIDTDGQSYVNQLNASNADRVHKTLELVNEDGKPVFRLRVEGNTADANGTVHNNSREDEFEDVSSEEDEDDEEDDDFEEDNLEVYQTAIDSDSSDSDDDQFPVSGANDAAAAAAQNEDQQQQQVRRQRQEKRERRVVVDEYHVFKSLMANINTAECEMRNVLLMDVSKPNKKLKAIFEAGEKRRVVRESRAKRNGNGTANHPPNHDFSQMASVPGQFNFSPQSQQQQQPPGNGTFAFAGQNQS